VSRSFLHAAMVAGVLCSSVLYSDGEKHGLEEGRFGYSTSFIIHS
jgi:hypothetical protein